MKGPVIEVQDRSGGGKPSAFRANSDDAGPVRRFVAADIPRVAALHRWVFRVPEPGCVFRQDHELSARLLKAYEAYFHEVFLNGPWQDERIGSLVYEDGDGEIVGFLGVFPRRMLWNEAAVQMAVCTQFVVDPRRRGMVGLRLLAEHFKGPQDLSVTDEANAGTRRAWEARGGRPCPAYCVHWIRPLRPARWVVSVLEHKRPGWLARSCAPLARAADAAGARLPGSPLHPPVSRLAAEELDEATLLAELPGLARDRSFRPHYDHDSLTWTLNRAGLGKRGDRFHKITLKDADHQIAGWYIYFMDSAETGEVLQVAAKPRLVNAVFNHLLRHAWEQGAIALTGRLDPVLFRELSDKLCLFRFLGSSMLVHAKRTELLQPLYRGDAFFTRLEGEWCLRFRPDW